MKPLDALLDPPAVVETAVVDAAVPGGEAIAETINITDFGKVDLRVAKIVK